MQEEMTNLERATMMVCLNLGIVPFQLNLKEELAKMDPEEARITKRKFRKLRRKSMKKIEYVKFKSAKNMLAYNAIKREITKAALSIVKG